MGALNVFSSVEIFKIFLKMILQKMRMVVVIDRGHPLRSFYGGLNLSFGKREFMRRLGCAVQPTLNMGVRGDVESVE